VQNAPGQFASLIEAARHHLPLDELPDPALVGLVMVAAGLVLALWGARLVRVLLAVGFLAAGARAGTLLAPHVGISPIAGVIVAAVVACALGYGLYRLWVGVVLAMMLLVGALSIYAYSRALPSWSEFVRVGDAVGQRAVDGFVVPSPAQQAQQADVGVMARRYLAWLEQREPGIRRDVVAIAAGSVLAGLILGFVAGRFITVLWSSLLGVALIAGGLALLCATWRPEWLERIGQHPSTVGTGLLAAWGLAVIRQLVALAGARPHATPASQPA